VPVNGLDRSVAAGESYGTIDRGTGVPEDTTMTDRTASRTGQPGIHLDSSERPPWLHPLFAGTGDARSAVGALGLRP
jgi:hypothetical protein